MSHVATIDLEIKDLDALREAAAAIGLEFVAGQTSYRWYGQSVGDYPLPDGFTASDLGKCEHALRIPLDQQHPDPNFGMMPYEIGVVKRRDGRPGFTLLWDFWNRGCGLEDRVGANCNRLKQEYALAVAKRQARKQGFSVVGVQTLANGTKQLKLSK
jgi:hypothetical protein